jgi:hypothetical protein
MRQLFVFIVVPSVLSYLLRARRLERASATGGR